MEKETQRKKDYIEPIITIELENLKMPILKLISVSNKDSYFTENIKRYNEIFEAVINDENTISILGFSERNTEILKMRYKSGSKETDVSVGDHFEITASTVSKICKLFVIRITKDFTVFERTGKTELNQAIKKQPGSKGNSLDIFNLEQEHLNALSSAGIIDINQFENYKTEEILAIKRIGKVLFRRIQIILHYIGYKFKNEIDENIKKDIIDEVTDKESAQKEYKKKRKQIERLKKQIKKLQNESKDLNKEIIICKTLIEVRFPLDFQSLQSDELETLNIDERTIKILKENKITSISVLTQHTYMDIANIRGISEETAKKIQILLHYVEKKFEKDTVKTIENNIIPEITSSEIAKKELRSKKEKLKRLCKKIKKLEEQQKELNRIIEICEAIINSNINQELKIGGNNDKKR